MPKTTLKVRQKQWDYFNNECKVMSLRRDDLINRVLPGELALLEKISPCDAIGGKWLKDRWVTMWRTSDIKMIGAPVMLSEEVLERLNEVCTAKNIPRDAFFDCFLGFLTSRLVEPALVIKDPRTDKDIASQAADLTGNSDVDADEERYQLQDAALSWKKGKNTELWNPDLYSIRLAYDANKVETEIELLELFVTKTQKSK